MCAIIGQRTQVLSLHRQPELIGFVTMITLDSTLSVIHCGPRMIEPRYYHKPRYFETTLLPWLQVLDIRPAPQQHQSGPRLNPQ